HAEHERDVVRADRHGPGADHQLALDATAGSGGRDDIDLLDLELFVLLHLRLDLDGGSRLRAPVDGRCARPRMWAKSDDRTAGRDDQAALRLPEHEGPEPDVLRPP